MWFRTRTTHPITSTPTLIWMAPNEQRRNYQHMAKQWPHDTTGLSTLGEIGYLIWQATRMNIPFPEFGIVIHGEAMVGGVVGYFGDRSSGFEIEAIAVHPNYMEDESVLKALIEGIIDRSIANKMHGWVTCCVDRNDTMFWRKHGFSTKHELPNGRIVMARMGYFR